MTPVLDVLVNVAVDLTAALPSKDRYDRVLGAVRRVIACDAAALLAARGDRLLPIAVHGLRPDVLGRAFLLAEHPRLEIIARAEDPVLFPEDTRLPDPFDGLLEADPSAVGRVHACLGCPLRVEGQLVAVLTADSLELGAFDGLDRQTLAAVAALAGAAVRTTQLIEALEASASRYGLIASDLIRAAHEREGHELIGHSRVIERLREEIRLIGPTDFPVLVTGDTGVGKELVVRAIHAASRRSEEALCYVNCAALPEALVDSELFGHVRGAFTGAREQRPGKFDVANGGTLFLDEVGELPLAVQPKLLRALQQGEIQRVGADTPLHVDVRVLGATNRDLREAVAQGRFRSDLFHRLAVYPIHVPPLSERREDIQILAGYFAEQARHRLGTGPIRLHPLVLQALEQYDWPGNVRELENVISRLALRAASGLPRGDPVLVSTDQLVGGIDQVGPALVRSVALPSVEPGGRTLRQLTDDYQREVIRKELARTGGNRAATARALGLDRANLLRLARRLGLQP